ncbi:MAG: 2-alkenal reductase [Myxococcales bacterium]|nr:2-alkenal reductase [Myxococcales bacterium]
MRPGGRSIGIDLGTTNSCAAIVEDGQPRVIRSRLGYSTIPSIVTFDDQGEAVVGQAAEKRMVLQPEETIYGSKRLLGRNFLPGVIARFQPHFLYKLTSDEEGFVAAEVSGHAVPLVDVSAHILRELRRAADLSLGETTQRAVVTVPAYFNENQRACVREAGRRAGLDVIRIVNEPTAAALCFGFNRAEHKRLLVFDLGGGTFDVSIVELAGNTFTVAATHGDTFLGGLDFDRKITDRFLERVAKKLNREVDLTPIDRQRLRLAAQDVKHQLSQQEHAVLSIEHVTFTDGTRIRLSGGMTREDLESLTRDLVDRTIAVVQETLDMVSLKPSDIDEVLLVGGQTRMPAVHRRLHEMFQREPTKRIHPDEVVALGAAIVADAQDRTDDTAVLLRDVLPLSIGIATSDGLFMPVILRNTPIPHDGTATIDLPPRTREVKILVFQGDHKQAADNEFLGALVVDGLTPVKFAEECRLVFHLDEECLLKVHATVPYAGIDREVTLATQQTPDELMAEMGKIRVSVPPPLRPAHEPRPARAAEASARPRGRWRRVLEWFLGD